MSTAQEVRWLEAMKSDHFDVWGETCPHYCLLDTADVARLTSLVKVNPPLRSASDRAALLDGLKRGVIDFLATDHAPHLPAAKRDPANPPSGIAGIEALAPAAAAVCANAGLGMAELVALTSANACRCYGIRERGAIADGHLADLAVLGAPGECPQTGVVTRAGAHPFLDWELPKAVFATFVAGQPAFRDGRFLPVTEAEEAMKP
jgi:dihydroorotase-like cyclic amidohydrolase